MSDPPPSPFFWLRPECSQKIDPITRLAADLDLLLWFSCHPLSSRFWSRFEWSCGKSDLKVGENDQILKRPRKSTYLIPPKLPWKFQQKIFTTKKIRAENILGQELRSSCPTYAWLWIRALSWIGNHKTWTIPPHTEKYIFRSDLQSKFGKQIIVVSETKVVDSLEHTNGRKARFYL